MESAVINKENTPNADKSHEVAKDYQPKCVRRTPMTAVELLMKKIADACHANPSPDLAIVVNVATTDKQARDLGWPSVLVMRQGVKRALELLPPHIVDRVELEEV